MIELNVTLDVALKSGAKVLLSEAQTRSVISYIETIITGEANKDLLPSVKELVRKRKYRRRGTRRSFTADEDAQVLALIRTYPVLGKGNANKARGRAIKNLAKELNRTEASVNSRIALMKQALVTPIPNVSPIPNTRMVEVTLG